MKIKDNNFFESQINFQNRVPLSKQKKDFITFVVICILTVNFSIFFTILEQRSSEDERIQELFNIDYQNSFSSQIEICSSKFHTNTMILEFFCFVPKGSEKVWVKLNNSEWIPLLKQENFILQSKEPFQNASQYSIELKCDTKSFEFTTKIYKQDLPTIQIFSSNPKKIISNESEECHFIFQANSTVFKETGYFCREIIGTIRNRNSGNGFSIELNQHESLLDMRKDDDWVLIPNRNYFNALRTKFAMDLFNSLSQLDPMCIAPKSEPVEIFLNGYYLGVYLLTEKIDRKLFNLPDNPAEISEENSVENPIENLAKKSVIFKLEDWQGDFFHATSQGNDKWEQIYPKSYPFDDEYLRLEEFIQTSSDEMFFNEISGIFSFVNYTQLMDFILFDIISGHNSIEGYKYYLVQNEFTQSQFCFIPWDFDMSWGFTNSFMLSPDYWLNQDSSNIQFIRWNKLIQRILYPQNTSLNTQFLTDLSLRWVSIRNSIWTSEYIQDSLTSLFNQMSNSMLRQNKSEVINLMYTQMSDWIDVRLPLMDQKNWSHNNDALKNISTSNLPSISLTYSAIISKESYVQCNFEMFNSTFDNNVLSMKSKIKIRGRSASTFPKKGYRIELDKKESLLGMRFDDDWSLFGMNSDFPRMRLKISMDLWRGLQSNSSTATLPQSEYVNLVINGVYQGLYLLAEKNDPKLYNLDDPQPNINSSLIFQAITWSSFREYKNYCWEQDFPDIEDGNIIDEILTDLIAFVSDSPDEIFYNETFGVYSIFNKQNLIDYYLYNVFIGHLDFWGKNYYIIRNTAPNQFFFNPWDFDGTFGQWGWWLGELNETEGAIGWFGDDIPGLHILRQSRIYNRLLENSAFSHEIKLRWKDLRTRLWTEQYFQNMYNSNYNKISPVLALDLQLWKPTTVDTELPFEWPNFVLYSTETFVLNTYLEHLQRYFPQMLSIMDDYCA
ncbi:hypothetical protein NEF87_004288 [Candidatus Lokiarchaeum ossiferum]|uniref:CotH kinase family protein n=1 Tax=Candidatus Lokiarchaeum ossiferum TaxID=2951803 RepID=A0ABY6HXA2_9ARCH|nr:hypothetical protein NEF87_004288 [Candidatus Lokiarchaeum sp. B-35]